VADAAGEDRRTVLVFDDEWMPRWLELVDHVEMAAPEAVQTLVLKRWNAGAFRRWLAELGASAERAEQWLHATGGFAVAARQLDGDLVADRDAEDHDQFASVLADSSGLERVPLAAAALKELADLGSASAIDLRELVGDGHTLVEIDSAARLLTLLGLARAAGDGYAVNDRVPVKELAARL
jgi:hypothetical protein